MPETISTQLDFGNLGVKFVVVVFLQTKSHNNVLANTVSKQVSNKTSNTSSNIMYIFLWSPNLISNAQNIKDKKRTNIFPTLPTFHFSRIRNIKTSAFYGDF